MNTRPDPGRTRRVGLARVTPVVTVTAVGSAAVTVAVAGGLAVASARTHPVAPTVASTPSTGNPEDDPVPPQPGPQGRSAPAHVLPGNGGGQPDAQSQAS